MCRQISVLEDNQLRTIEALIPLLFAAVIASCGNEARGDDQVCNSARARLVMSTNSAVNPFVGRIENTAP